MSEDLRSRRTKKHLMEAFDATIREKPLNKITVKSIAEAAEVSKQAFYLHYRDIYDIAEKWTRMQIEEIVNGMDFLDTLFSDPHAFIKSLFAVLKENHELEAVFFRNDLHYVFAPCFLESLSARITETNPSHLDDLHESVASTMILSGILALIPRYGDDNADAMKAAGDILAHISAGMKASVTL